MGSRGCHSAEWGAEWSGVRADRIW
jgi:hypothetical protein